LTTNLDCDNFGRRLFISILVGSATLETAMAKSDVPVEPRSEPTPPIPAHQAEPSEHMKQSTRIARGLISLAEAEAHDRGWDGSDAIVFHFQMVDTPNSVEVTLGKTANEEKTKPPKEQHEENAPTGPPRSAVAS
jgi:hypothetical protein